MTCPEKMQAGANVRGFFGPSPYPHKYWPQTISCRWKHPNGKWGVRIRIKTGRSPRSCASRRPRPVFFRQRKRNESNLRKSRLFRRSVKTTHQPGWEIGKDFIPGFSVFSRAEDHHAMINHGANVRPWSQPQRPQNTGQQGKGYAPFPAPARRINFNWYLHCSSDPAARDLPVTAPPDVKMMRIPADQPDRKHGSIRH